MQPWGSTQGAVRDSVQRKNRFMSFSDEELELAQLFKAYGLCWEPAQGHYVLDQSQLLPHRSPFQERVFFILDVNQFIRRAGSLDNLKEGMCWLPTFEQVRNYLREQGVSDDAVAVHLAQTKAIENGSERLELYRLMEECLTGGI